LPPRPLLGGQEGRLRPTGQRGPHLLLKAEPLAPEFGNLFGQGGFVLQGGRRGGQPPRLDLLQFADGRHHRPRPVQGLLVEAHVDAGGLDRRQRLKLVLDLPGLAGEGPSGLSRLPVGGRELGRVTRQDLDDRREL
jgi:hypothetical protein